MSTPISQRLSDRVSMQRMLWLPLGLSVLLVLMVLTGLVAMSWRSLDRLQPMQTHLAHIARIQNIGLTMEQTLLKGLRGARIDRRDLQRLSEQVRQVARLEGTMYPDTRQSLEKVAQRIAQAAPDSVEVLFEALGQLRAVLANEHAQHDGLLAGVIKSTRAELRLAIILLVVLPLGGGIALLLLRQRTAQPLKDLQNLLDRLSRRDLRPVPAALLDDTARAARPAFTSFNALVLRLQALEAEHLDRESTLELRVREATEALLTQSRELSRAERLAAVGAVSAGLAHELRNPLAGIQLACAKLHKTVGDSDQAARISAVIGELKRINHLLTEQVDAARHAPEPSVRIGIRKSIDELLALLRFQTPSGIQLVAHIDESVECVLPAAGLRQALLNLLLNAVQVQGDAGRIDVAAKREAGRLSIRISDEGPGFPDELLRVGIRPFATHRAGGTGLGLAMVRRFVRDLDGDLKLENCSPRGARVTMYLPCASAAQPEERAHA